jgi:flagellar basal-body rod modification protein FlgD
MHANSLTPASLLSSTAQTNTIQAATKAKPQTAATPTTGSSSNTGLTSSSAGTTFLNLLVKELQNQDPTSPMDSTQMVGQMISLNQLDQLISINQTLSSATTSTSTTKHVVSASGATGAPAVSSSDQIAQRAALLNGTQNLNAVQAGMQSTTDPNAALDLSTLNMPHGGK